MWSTMRYLPKVLTVLICALALSVSAFAEDPELKWMNPFSGQPDYTRNLGALGGDLIPAADATYDIGSAALSWEDGYFHGDIYVASDTISISNTGSYGLITGLNGEIEWASTDLTDIGTLEADKIDTPEIYNSLGDLKIMPDRQGDVILFGDTDVANAADGKSLYVYRKAEEGDNYFQLYTDNFRIGRLAFNGIANPRFEIRNDSGGEIQIGVSNAASLALMVGASGDIKMFEASGVGENRYLKQSGYITTATNEVDMLWQVNDTTDMFELTRENVNVLGFDVQMPLITDGITVSGDLSVSGLGDFGTYLAVGGVDAGQTLSYDIASREKLRYNMDDNAASTTVLDTSGEVNTGQAWANTSTISVNGPFGDANDAIDFTGGTTDYIDITTDIAYIADWCISFWIFCDIEAPGVSSTYPPDDSVICGKVGSATEYLSVADGNGILFEAQAGVNVHWDNDTDFYNKWRWVCINKTSSSVGKARMEAWVGDTDGNLKSLGMAIISGSYDELYVEKVGYGFNVTSKVFDGKLSRFQVCNDDLTISEIESLFNNGAGAKTNTGTTSILSSYFSPDSTFQGEYGLSHKGDIAIGGIVEAGSGFVFGGASYMRESLEGIILGRNDGASVDATMEIDFDNSVTSVTFRAASTSAGANKFGFESDVQIADEINLRLGTSGSDSMMRWETSGNDFLALYLRLNSTSYSGNFALLNYNHHYRAWDFPSVAYPTLCIFSDENPTEVEGTVYSTHYMRLFHKRTGGVIQTMYGNLEITLASGNISCGDSPILAGTYNGLQIQDNGGDFAFTSSDTSGVLFDPATAGGHISINQSLSTTDDPIFAGLFINGVSDLGDGGTTNYASFAADGELSLHGTAKVTRSKTFTFNYSRITAQGKPTLVNRGVFFGWSLPVYNTDDEELFTCNCIPTDWDGTADPVVCLTGWLDTANTDKKFNLQVSVEYYDPVTKQVIPITSNDYTTETDTGTAAQYTSFLVCFTLDASAIAVSAGQPLGIRVRRIVATSVEIAGEFVVEGMVISYTSDKLGS